MSAILTAKGLAAGHADRLLFSGLDVVVAPGEITGLVGANGAGKPVTELGHSCWHAGRTVAHLVRGYLLERTPTVLDILRLREVCDAL